jgi:hypothetical protein
MTVLLGPRGIRRVHAQHRGAQVVRVAGEEVYEGPRVPLDTRKPGVCPTLASLVGFVVDLLGADLCVAAREGDHLPLEVPFLLHTCEAVMDVEVVVVELAVGVVPELVVGVYEGPVGEDLRRLGVYLLDDGIQGWPDMILQGSTLVVEIDVDEAAVADLSLDLTQAEFSLVMLQSSPEQ